MGWVDKAFATAKLSVDLADQASKRLARELDQELSSREDYRHARGMAAELAEMGKGALAIGQEVSTEVTQGIGATDTGARAGKTIRSVADLAANLPVLTALADALKARHGVVDLYQHLLQEPHDPERSVWLAEALDRVQEDLATYQKVRSVTSLTYAARRRLMVGALELGREASDDTRVRLLKNAFQRARQGLLARPDDARMLHVLARVYLSTGDPDTAGRLAKLSILADDRDGAAWVTLARVFVARGEYAMAREAAARAITAGAGYGNEILAQVVLCDPNQGGNAAAEYERLRSLVTAEDRSAYSGTAVGPRSVAQDVWDKQVRRAADTLDLLRSKR